MTEKNAISSESSELEDSATPAQNCGPELSSQDEMGSVISLFSQNSMVVLGDDRKELTIENPTDFLFSMDNGLTFVEFSYELHGENSEEFNECNSETLFKDKTDILSFCHLQCPSCLTLLRFDFQMKSLTTDQIVKAYRDCKLTCDCFPDATKPRMLALKTNEQIHEDICLLSNSVFCDIVNDDDYDDDNSDDSDYYI